MPAAIPIVVAVAGAAASAAAKKLTTPKVKPGEAFDPRLPTQTMDLFSQSGVGDEGRSQFGQQLLTALSGSLAKFGGGPAPSFNFGGAQSPMVTPVPGAGAAAPQPMQPRPGGSVGALLARQQQEA